MAIRTTSANVQAILGKNYDGTTSLTPYIDAATVVVDRVKTCSDKEAEPLSGAELELVERWLSAHFYQQMDQGYAAKSTDGASARYQGETGMYLAGTKYGQQAMFIDFTG